MIKLKVNGVSRQFDGDPEMPLLWFLRDDLQLIPTASKRNLKAARSSARASL